MRGHSRNALLLIATTTMLGSSASAATVSQDQPNEVFIRACKLQFKPEAMRAKFDATVRYAVTTSATGEVTDVIEDPASTAPPPFRPVFQPIEECLKSWRLHPSVKYQVELRWGSGGGDWSWRACPSSGDCIQVVLPK